MIRLIRADAIALSPTRRKDALFGFLLLATAAVAGLAIHPAVGLAAMTVALVLTVLDWRVSAVSLLGVFLAVVLLVPADIRLAVPLPLDPTADRLLLAFLLAAWACGLLEVDAPAPSTPVRRVGSALKAVLAVAFLSLLVNGPRSIAAGSFAADLKALVVLAVIAASYFLTVAVVGGREDVERLLRVAVISGAVAGVAAAYERFMLVNPFRTVLLAVPAFKATRTAEELTRGSDLRVAGSGEHPIAFGGAMAMLLPIALYLTLTTEKRARLAWGSATALIAAGMLFSVSRSALISTVVAYALLLLLWPRWRKALVVVALIGGFAVHMLVPGLLGTFRSTLQPSWVMKQESDENSSARFTDYPRVAAIIPRQPLFGLGYADFDPRTYFYLDNQLLKFALELGVAGLAVLALFVGRAGALLFRAARAGPRDGTPVEVALIASAAAFLTLSVFFDTFGFVQVTYLFFVLTALGIRAAEDDLRGPAAVVWEGRWAS